MSLFYENSQPETGQTAELNPVLRRLVPVPVPLLPLLHQQTPVGQPGPE